MSAFRPWAQPPPKHLPPLPYPPNIPYLNQEPPVLQNPERVVRLTECERFERSFQPNVALAPKRHSSPLPKERDKERGDIIMSTEVQIKQERASTPTPPPPATIVTDSPELRLPAPSPVTTVHESAPFSPDALSGSNEITSSTSPVLAMSTTKSTNETMIKCERSPVPVENNHHHHHLNHHHHTNNSHHNTNNSNTNTTNNTNHHHHPQSSLVIKSGTTAIVVNSEFELSTDTDDDSMAGEPDSSNTNVPLEMAADIMKNARPEERDKILHIIKLLVHENIQLRHFSVENQNLLDELRRKDEQISELLQQQQFEQQHRRHLLVATPIKNTNGGATNGGGNGVNTSTTSSSSPLTNINRDNLGLDVVISPVEIATTPNSINNSNSNTNKMRNDYDTSCNKQSTTNHYDYHHHNHRNDKCDVIMKPLKKSARRSPEDAPPTQQQQQPPSSYVVTVHMQSPATTPTTTTSSTPMLTTIKREQLSDDDENIQQTTRSTPHSLLNGHVSGGGADGINSMTSQHNSSSESITRICSNSCNNEKLISNKNNTDSG